jgi:hypothetical protein
MRKLVLAVLLSSVAFPAFAQGQPKFVPFTVDEKSMTELQTWLLEQPFKFSSPVFQWLSTHEKQATEDAAKAAAPVPPAPDKK